MKRVEKLAEDDARGGTSTGEWYKPEDFSKILDSVRKCAFMRGYRAAIQDAAGVAEKYYYSKYTQVNGDSPEEIWEYDANLAAEIRALAEEEDA